MSHAISISAVTKQYQFRGTGNASERTLKSAMLAGAKRFMGSAPVLHSVPFTALDNISLDIDQGDAFGLIGPNGAGKSTLLKILARIIAPTHGRVIIQGRVGSLLEVGTGFHAELSGRENIHLACAIQGMSAKQIRQHFDAIVDFSEVEEFLDLPIKHYSTGMYMKLAFSVAAHIEPDVLLVDEALAVGDVRFQRKCLVRMRELAQRSSAVVLVSHHHESITQFCNRAAWLDGGRLMQVGASVDVVAGYLASLRTDAPTMQWQGDAGDNTLRLRATYVRFPTEGQHETTSDLIIGFRAELLQPAINLVAAIEIRSERGTLLVYSAYDDNLPPPANEVPAGTFAREVRIPSNTFAHGVYSVTFDFGIHNAYRIVDGAGALMFELKNNNGYGRRFLTEHWSGILRPAWRWIETESR
jgi:lipopolysaccharide transport system ATP-binding protein